MWQDLIVYAILALVAAYSLWGLYRRLTGKSSCCGGGGACSGSCGNCGAAVPNGFGQMGTGTGGGAQRGPRSARRV